MEGPYRQGHERAPVVAREVGLVDDVVRQFADRFAFLRELIQNALDAGTTSVRVQLFWERAPEGGLLTVSVRDDGEGMDRAVLEEQLVVLFRSTKEDQQDAIGKFGVGFASVLAVEPYLVAVRTCRGDGVLWILHLHADHSYELFQQQGGATRGTTVTLHVPLAEESLEGFVQSSVAALRTWCRHASAPIHFTASVEGEEAPRRQERIDRPLGLEALVSVEIQSEDEGTRAIVGLRADAGRFAAFFNRGLTLFETQEILLGPSIAFAVQDARLEHTLSRDNVRRDDAFDAALRLVKEVGVPALVAACAAEVARRAQGDDGSWEELMGALEASALPLPKGGWTYPLLCEVGGRSALRADELDTMGAGVASERTALVEVLARSGRAVVDGSRARAGWLQLSALSSLRLQGDPHERLTLVQPLEPADADSALLGLASDLLDGVHRRPRGMVLADLVGAASGELSVASPSSLDPWVVPRNKTDDDPFRLLLRPLLVLNAAHPIVEGARRARDPRLGAALLARALLVQHRALDDRRAEALTSRAIEALLGGGR